MMRMSVPFSNKWVAKLWRLFRLRNKRHNSECRIIPSGGLNGTEIQALLWS